MRWICVGVVGLFLVGCGQAGDPSGPRDTAANARDVAFSYAYDFRLPSTRISDAQERHAQACEALGQRCRITGMTYRVDGSGQVSASLDVRVAGSIARGFGRAAVKGIEQAGGALTGAEIIGVDAAPAMTAGDRAADTAQADLTEIDRQLARTDLQAAVRARLIERRATIMAGRRDALAAATAARDSVSTTPIAFAYHAGSGVGLAARLTEAAHAAYLSLTWTLATVLTVAAYLGPPVLLGLLLLLFWARIGRRLWERASSPRPPSGDE